MSKIKVLFLCTGNSARSQMAEAFLRQYGGDRFEAHSCGLEARGINPLTRQVMADVGNFMEGQTSKDVSTYLGKVNFGYLITVCSHAEKNCPTTFLGISHREHWAFDDPDAFEGSPEERLAKFRKVRDEVEVKVKEFIARV